MLHVADKSAALVTHVARIGVTLVASIALTGAVLALVVPFCC